MEDRREFDPFAPAVSTEAGTTKEKNAVEDVIFPAQRFRQAGASEDEVSQLQDEFDRSDQAAQSGLADSFESMATGDLVEYLERLRTEGHFVAEKVEAAAVDVEHDVEHDDISGLKEEIEADEKRLEEDLERLESSSSEDSAAGAGGAPQSTGEESGAPEVSADGFTRGAIDGSAPTY